MRRCEERVGGGGWVRYLFFLFLTFRFFSFLTRVIHSKNWRWRLEMGKGGGGGGWIIVIIIIILIRTRYFYFFLCLTIVFLSSISLSFDAAVLFLRFLWGYFDHLCRCLFVKWVNKYYCCYSAVTRCCYTRTCFLMNCDRFVACWFLVFC